MQDALKGFHPIEYLIFGLNGDKTVAEFTPRQCEYLAALTANLYELTSDLNNRWNGTSPYGWHLTNAGPSSIFYPTRKAAFEEITFAMIGIAEEVANGKLREPFMAQNADLEESPFAKNSIRDFYNNIVGIEMVYLGQYEANGHGMEDFVRTYNLSIDNDIKQKISAAKSALNNITDPFGTAITTQPIQVQNAIDAINALGETLESGLIPLIELHVTN
jgi:predicted lipoprotein